MCMLLCRSQTEVQEHYMCVRLAAQSKHPRIPEAASGRHSPNSCCTSSVLPAPCSVQQTAQLAGNASDSCCCCLADMIYASCWSAPQLQLLRYTKWHSLLGVPPVSLCCKVELSHGRHDACTACVYADVCWPAQVILQQGGRCTNLPHPGLSAWLFTNTVERHLLLYIYFHRPG
jgi:hypothetical protein